MCACVCNHMVQTLHVQDKHEQQQLKQQQQQHKELTHLIRTLTLKV